MSNSVLLQGDCLEMLKQLPDNSVDSLITDPPAGIAFMGKSWDEDKGGRKQWIKWMSEVMTECLRVMKPGAHGLVWALPRTSHWTGTALEDAGFQIRDTVHHAFGSGFPKSLNTTKQVEKGYECQYLSNVRLVENQSVLIPVELNEERIGFVAVNAQTRPEDGQESGTVTGVVVDLPEATGMSLYVSTELTDSNTTLLLRSILEDDFFLMKKSITLTKLKTIIDLKIWNLLPHQSTLKNTIALNGTSLKPAHEVWWLIRKPCSEDTVAANVLVHGTGGINIDASRIGTEVRQNQQKDTKAWSGNQWSANPQPSLDEFKTVTGRFPANLIFSHNHDCVEVEAALGVDKDNSEPTQLTPNKFECTEGCPVAELDRQSNQNVSRFFKVCGQENIKVEGTFAGKNQENKNESLNTGGYGSGHMEQSQTDTKFITSTRIRSTTTSLISSASAQNNTTTSIKENGKTTRSLMESNTENVNDVCSMSSYQDLALEDLEPTKGTVRNVAEHTCESGKCQTQGILGNGPETTSGSRFVYQAKASKKDKGINNLHPTVKSQALMTYLIKLITPPGGIVLDCFMGSGSTGVSAIKNGFAFIGIEKETEYYTISEKRIQGATNGNGKTDSSNDDSAA